MSGVTVGNVSPAYKWEAESGEILCQTVMRWHRAMPFSVRQFCVAYQHPTAIWRGWNEAGESISLSVNLVILDLPPFDSTGARIKSSFFMQILYVSHKAIKPPERERETFEGPTCSPFGMLLRWRWPWKRNKILEAMLVICLAAASLVSLLRENWSAPLPAGFVVADYLLLLSKKAEGVGNAVWLYRWLIFHQTEASLWVTDLMLAFKTGFLAIGRALWYLAVLGNL